MSWKLRPRNSMEVHPVPRTANRLYSSTISMKEQWKHFHSYYHELMSFNHAFAETPTTPMMEAKMTFMQYSRASTTLRRRFQAKQNNRDDPWRDKTGASSHPPLPLRSTLTGDLCVWGGLCTVQQDET